MKKRLFGFLRFLTFLGVGAGILYYVYQKQNAAYQEDCALKGIAAVDCDLIGKVADDIASSNFFWLSLVFAVFVISNFSRAIRWVMLLRPMGYRPKLANAFWCTMVGYLTNLGIPRSGEFVKAGLLGKYENIPVEKVMGTVVTDRIVDVISLAVVMGLALLIEYETIYTMITDLTKGKEGAETDGGSNVLIWLGGVAAIVVVLFGLFYKKIVQNRFFQKILDIGKGFLEGIQTVRKLDNPGWFVFHSANIWFMYFLMMYFGLKAYEPVSHLGMGAALVLFVTGGLAFLIPAPGGMGSYQLMITEVCEKMYGIDGANGFSFSMILFFFIQILTNISLGITALIVLPIINRDK